MKGADRTKQIKLLVKVAAAILRRNAAGFIVEGPDGRARFYDLRHNEMTLSLRRRVDDPAHTIQLEIRFDGARALFAEWNDDGFVKRSLTPGRSESVLRRYERIPALAGRPTR